MVAAASQEWPASLAGTPAVLVLERALTERRLAHSLLLHGEDLATLTQLAYALADRLLNVPAGRARFAPAEHPDCFALRPAGKMRQIRIGENDRDPGTMREFLRKLSVSASVAPHKVGIVYEADRMNVQTANAFLKTLEEPPAHTTLLLLTTRPYALLPTILSRVLRFRFVAAAAPVLTDGWSSWLADYRAWLSRLAAGTPDKRIAADHVFSCYGLVARFSTVLDRATAAAWEQEKAGFPADLEDDAKVAIEVGLANGIRTRLFAEIEQATRTFALPRLCLGDPLTRSALTESVERLEHAVSLLRLNLNESAALEDFLLATLRLWSRR